MDCNLLMPPENRDQSWLRIGNRPAIHASADRSASAWGSRPKLGPSSS
jgi:hypothetical protein